VASQQRHILTLLQLDDEVLQEAPERFVARADDAVLANDFEVDATDSPVRPTVNHANVDSALRFRGWEVPGDFRERNEVLRARVDHETVSYSACAEARGRGSCCDAP
jgi:hypothetical protein